MKYYLLLYFLDPAEQMTNTFLEKVGLRLFKMWSKAKNENIRKNKNILKCIYDEMTNKGLF